MANSVLDLLAAAAAYPEVHEAAEVAGAHHPQPELLGWMPYQFVSLAMLVLILIAIFGAKVHKSIAKGLDGKIAAIREQLEEAKKLRAEAEALRGEYAAKIANAEKDAAAMLEHAKSEAILIVEKAQADTATMIARRERMAEDKIAAAERGVIDELRANSAKAAAAAAAQLIAAYQNAANDSALVDEAISAI